MGNQWRPLPIRSVSAKPVCDIGFPICVNHYRPEVGRQHRGNPKPGEKSNNTHSKALFGKSPSLAVTFRIAGLRNHCDPEVRPFLKSIFEMPIGMKSTQCTSDDRQNSGLSGRSLGRIDRAAIRPLAATRPRIAANDCFCHRTRRHPTLCCPWGKPKADP